MELLAQRIRRSNDIKGIHIHENEEVKLTQYADDTTAILANVQSVSNLFELLSSFEKCSGLKINQAKSEMLCAIGKMQFATSKLAMILSMRSGCISLTTLSCPRRKFF